MRLALGVLLLALLTWLLLRSIDTNASGYAETLQAIDDFALAETSLRRDVLQARAGLLRDYDGLGKSENAMENAVARMRSNARAAGLDADPIDRLNATVAQQEDLTERFKSDNSLLQNSLSYVSQLGTEPALGSPDANLASATGALATAILRLTLDTSPAAASALERAIDGFAARVPAEGPDGEAARALLAHARLLRELLPELDQTLSALVAVPSRKPFEETRALFAGAQAVVEKTAQRFRLLLYLASLLLLVMVVRLGLWLRTRTLALRQSEMKFRDYAETASDWFWEIGPDYKFTLLSGNAFGSDSAARIGTTCWDHTLDLETEPEKWRLFRATLDARKPFRDFVYCSKNRNGSPM